MHRVHTAKAHKLHHGRSGRNSSRVQHAPCHHWRQSRGLPTGENLTCAHLRNTTHLCLSIERMPFLQVQNGLLARRTLGLTVRATHSDGTPVVIKLISRGGAVHSNWHAIDRMVRCQQALTHPHIVRLVEVRNTLSAPSSF